MKSEYYSLENQPEIYHINTNLSIFLVLIWLCLSTTQIAAFPQDDIVQQPSLEIQLDSVRTLIGSNQYDAALTYLEDIPVINTSDLHVQHQLLLGTIYFHQGFFDKALAQFEYTLDLHGEGQDVVYADLNSWIGSSYLRLMNLPKAKTYFNKTLVLRKKLLGPKDEKVSYVYNNLGIVADDNAQFDEAIKYYQLALDIVTEIYGDNHIEVADYHFKIGDTYTKKKNYVLADDYLQKSLGYYVQNLGTDHYYTAPIYYGLGLFYREIGNIKRASTYLENAATIFEKILGSEHQKVNYIKYELATVFLEAKDYDKAETLLRTAIKNYLSREEEDNYLVAHANEALGKTLMAKKQYQPAINYYKKAIQATELRFGTNHQMTYDNYLSLAQSLVTYGDYAYAKQVFEKTEAIGLKIFPENSIKLSEVYLSRSNCYLVQHQLVKAKHYLVKAKEVFTGLKEETLYNKELAEMELLEVQLYLKDEKKQHLYKADSLITVVEQRLNDLKKYFQSVASGQSLNSQFYDFYQLAIETNYQLYENTKEQQYLERAFSYSEKSKTFVLMRTLQEEEAILVAGIPDSLVRQIDDLSAAISFKEKLLFENEQQPTPNELLSDSLSGRLFQLQTTHEGLLNQIEKDFPTYYQLKYELAAVSLSSLQQRSLTKQHSLVEYFVGDTSFYVFIINKQTTTVQRLPKSKDLEQSIQYFRNSIYNYQPLQNNDSLVADFGNYGVILYQALIAPIEKQLQPNLIIVANDFLEYLPFGALVKRKGKDLKRFRTYQYLMDDYAISYAYSASWLQTKQQQRHHYFEKEYLGVAPVFTGQEGAMDKGKGGSLTPLKFNTQEVTQVKNILNGEILQGLQATKTAFKAIANKYRILHLATHGKSNNEAGDYSFLAFSSTVDSTTNSFFYVKDLLDLALPTELVVLSACETGTGEIQKGEGVVSLGKGFSYAGVKSLLTTLWTVSDQATSKLIPLFFKELKAGHSKDKALQFAKQQFLKENRDAHPYYWSGYIMIGDTTPMKFGVMKTSVFWLGGIVVSLSLGLLFLLFRRRFIVKSRI